MGVGESGRRSLRKRRFNRFASKRRLPSGNLILNLRIKADKIVIRRRVADGVVLLDNNVVLQEGGVLWRADSRLGRRGDHGCSAQEVGDVSVEQVLVRLELAQPGQTGQLGAILVPSQSGNAVLSAPAASSGREFVAREDIPYSEEVLRGRQKPRPEHH